MITMAARPGTAYCTVKYQYSILLAQLVENHCPTQDVCKGLLVIYMYFNVYCGHILWNILRRRENPFIPILIPC